MKKRIYALFIIVVCAALALSIDQLGYFDAWSDALRQGVDEERIVVSGEVHFFQKFKDGFLIQYQKEDAGSYLCFLDEKQQVIWEHGISTTFDSLYVFGEDGFFIRTADGHVDNGFARLDENGNVLWEIGKMAGNIGLDTAFSDRAGGVYFLGTDYDNNHQSMIFHIDQNGQIMTQEPFGKMEGVSAVFHAPDRDDGDWFLATQTDMNNEFLMQMDANLKVTKKFELLERQYPSVLFLPEEDRIILYGQAYQSDPLTEYGFVYEIDYDMNQKQYIEFDDCVPRSVIQRKDGGWLVSCYDRINAAVDKIKVYSADWKELSAINIDYAFTELFALNDGGFAIVGSRLPPGQPDATLCVSSVRPQMDLIYQRYDAKCKLKCTKTYSAQDSESGYGYRFFVDKSGKLFLF